MDLVLIFMTVSSYWARLPLTTQKHLSLFRRSQCDVAFPFTKKDSNLYVKDATNNVIEDQDDYSEEEHSDTENNDDEFEDLSYDFMFILK